MKDPYILNSVVLNCLSLSEIEGLEKVGQDIANKEGAITHSEVIIRILRKGLDQHIAEMDEEGMGDGLKPCPFCGGEAVERTNKDPDAVYSFHILCRDCKAHMKGQDRLKLTEKWNRRAGE